MKKENSALTFDETITRFIEGTQVYIAIGQRPEYAYFDDEMLKSINIERGKIKVKENGQLENYPWLFAGGDIVKGPDIITGVATGHTAANGIDEYLRSKK